MLGFSPQPGLARVVLFLEITDGIGVLHRQTNVVETIEQAILTKRVNLERYSVAVRGDDCLRLEIDREAIAGLIRELAQTACSRDEPQAKFSRASKICAC